MTGKLSDINANATTTVPMTGSCNCCTHCYCCVPFGFPRKVKKHQSDCSLNTSTQNTNNNSSSRTNSDKVADSVHTTGTTTLNERDTDKDSNKANPIHKVDTVVLTGEDSHQVADSVHKTATTVLIEKSSTDS